jgi:hypothetical protein
MNVNVNAKFGVFFLSGCHSTADFPQEEELEPGLWVSQGVGFEFAEHWREWIGSLAVEEMGRDGLSIYATAPSERPEVSDGENVALQQRVTDVLNALFLQGVPSVGQSFVGHGANIDGNLRLRSYTPIGRHIITNGAPAFIVGIWEVRRALWLAKRIRYVVDQYERNRNLAEWSRIIRGLRTLLAANRMDNTIGDRLHQFVRATEAVIKPPPLEGKKKFAHRGQTIVLAGDDARVILEQLYAIRGAVEHLNVPHDAVTEGTAAERIALVSVRTRQAEALARFALLRVLESPMMFNIFRTEQGVDEFWRLQDHARTLLWGTRLVITGVT